MIGLDLTEGNTAAGFDILTTTTRGTIYTKKHEGIESKPPVTATTIGGHSTHRSAGKANTCSQHYTPLVALVHPTFPVVLREPPRNTP